MIRVALALIAAAGCATEVPKNAQKWPDISPCLNQETISHVKPGLEKIVDRVEKTPGPKTTELVSEACDKEIYRRGSYRIIIYAMPQTLHEVREVPYNKKFEVIRGYAGVDRDVTAEQANACVDRALQDLQRIGVGSDTMALYRQRYAMQWNDPDVGPARFLNCTGKGLSYQQSLAVMVHEATHELTRNNCLYTLYSNYTVCFALPATLPSASIAATEVQDLIGEKSKYLEALQKAQTVYLSELPQHNAGPAFLFNELNAYTAGTEVMTALLRKDGPQGLVVDGKPVPVLLPLVSLWTVRYLSAMKKLDPDFYSEILAPGTSDRDEVDVLLSHAEQTHASWIAAGKENHLKPLPDEEQIWKQYLAEKKSVSQTGAGLSVNPVSRDSDR